MSGVSDKARFYVEQAVPQLQEFKEKKVFSQEEIRNLVKKRSNFEHRVHTRGATPIEFARYAAWEIGLEKLRQKRCKRLHVKSSAHTGQARIFNIFDRGTRKHPGDVALWVSYLEYVRSCKANKKFKAVLTAAIRLHPTKTEIWLYAARYSLESEVDMTGARSYFQRGIRFCPTSSDLWIEYAKLEMIYLAKIMMRRKILRLDTEVLDQNLKKIEPAEETPAFDASEDKITIPDFAPETLPSNTTEGNTQTVDLMSTPALNGAIPLAIFDSARTQLVFSSAVATKFFDLFATFTQLHCLPKILHHVVNSMMEDFPGESYTWYCYTRQPTIGIDHMSAEFPEALGLSLGRISESKVKTKDKAHYADITKLWIKSILELSELDPSIQMALNHMVLKLEQHF